MARFEKLMPHLLKWEGGFVCDPRDPGGATMRGITLETYKAYCRRKGYPRPTVERLRAMPLSEWEEIARTLYWDRWQADRIHSQRVANMLVDWLWHSGKYGIVIPQRLLGVEGDGVVGERTLAAVNARGEGFFAAVKQAREDYLYSLVRRRPPLGAFQRGWMNRINDL